MLNIAVVLLLQQLLQALSIACMPLDTSALDGHVPQTSHDFTLEETCGVRPKFTKYGNNSQTHKLRAKRIVGGSPALAGEWPWHVIVKESKLFGTVTDYKCGGALISSEFVLTAAHCRPGPILAHLVAVLGQYSLDEEGLTVIPVRRMTIHKKFDEASLHNDVALLQLETPADFSRTVRPICLPKSTDRFVGRHATVTGWGRLYFKGELPNTLHSVSLPILSHPQCENTMLNLPSTYVKEVPESFLCAGSNEGEFDACEGDSGGPLAVQLDTGKWVLAGTVSHGVRCAEPGIPGIYMKTSYYRLWIDEVIQTAEAAARLPPPQGWLIYLWNLVKSIPGRISTDVTHF